MAQSHGMSPQEHAKFLFNQQLDQLLPKERSEFLFDAVRDFVQRVEYKSGAPIGESDVWIAVHAAELLLEDYKNRGKQFSSSQLYLLDKFIEAVGAVSAKFSNVIDLVKLKADLRQVKEQQMRPALHPTHVLGNGSRNTPEEARRPNIAERVDGARQPRAVVPGRNLAADFRPIDLDNFRIEIKKRDNRPGSEILDIFRKHPKDDPYIAALKDCTRAFFERGQNHLVNRGINRLVVVAESLGVAKADVHKDVEAVLVRGVDQIAQMISNPKSYARTDVNNANVRRIAFDRLSSFIRKIEESQLPIESIFQEGQDAFQYFHTKEFREHALEQLETLLRAPSDTNLDRAWNVRKIAKAVGNTELETLSALAYAYYHETNESKIKMKSKMTEVLTSSALRNLPIEVLDRTVMNGKSWNDMAVAVVTGLENAGLNQAPGR